MKITSIIYSLLILTLVNGCNNSSLDQTNHNQQKTIAELETPKTKDKKTQFIGWVIICDFDQHGIVTLVKRRSGRKLIVDGKAHKLNGGSYFLESEYDPDVIIFFGPHVTNDEKFWEFKGVRVSECDEIPFDDYD